MDKAGVLKEIDCYISGSLRKQLLLLWYKNRSTHRALEYEHVKDGRMKSTLDLLELNIENGKNPSVGFDSDQTDSYLLRSDVMKLPLSVLGYFVNDECHFVPLESTSLVMDTIKEPMKEKSRAPVAPPPIDPEASGVVVSAKLHINDSGNLRGQLGSRRKPSDNDPDIIFRTQQNLAPWCPVRYRRFVADDAFETRIPLLYPYEDNDFVEQNSSGPRQGEYTTKLLSSLTATPTTSLGRVEPASAPTLDELVQSVMMKVHVIRFNKLVTCVRERFADPHEVTNAVVLQCVQKVAVLVRGWWVVKSDLLYPPTTYSEHGSIPSALLVRARDYIMAVFHRGEHLTRKTISSMTKLPALEATEILKLLAQKMSTTQKGYIYHWEFYPVDQDFVRRYPDIVQQQNAAWEARIRQLCGQLKLERLVSDGARRKRRCSGRLSSDSESEVETEFPSLVSGVHVSGSGGKRPPVAKRRRQLSLSQTSDTDTSLCFAQQPAKKRARTQSLSTTSTSGLLSPSSFISTAASRRPTAQAASFSFPIPCSPPNVIPRLTSPSGSRSTTPIPRSMHNSVVPVDRTDAPPTTTTTHAPISTSGTKGPEQRSPRPIVGLCKPEPEISAPTPTLPVRLSEIPKPHLMSSAAPVTPAIKQEYPDSGVSNGNSEEPRAYTGLDPALLSFVQDKVKSQPIIALSELVVMVQQSLRGTLDDLHTLDIPASERPPPGSEAERALLKPVLLEVLLQAGVRQLNVIWPTCSDVKPEEPLFTVKVAGSECGAGSETIRRMRDVLLEIYEKQPFCRMKEFQDRLEELSIKGVPRKTVCSMLKHFCVYRHNRYYLRQTLYE